MHTILSLKKKDMRIHFKSIRGMYEVVSYDIHFIVVKGAHRQFQMPSSDFKCLAGWQWQNRNESHKRFLKTMKKAYNLALATNPYMCERTYPSKVIRY